MIKLVIHIRVVLLKIFDCSRVYWLCCVVDDAMITPSNTKPKKSDRSVCFMKTLQRHWRVLLWEYTLHIINPPVYIPFPCFAYRSHIYTLRVYTWHYCYLRRISQIQARWSKHVVFSLQLKQWLTGYKCRFLFCAVTKMLDHTYLWAKLRSLWVV